jgi:hypothetical protein
MAETAPVIQGETGVVIGPARARRGTGQLSETVRFCDRHYSPAATPASRRPEPVSTINVAQPGLSQGSATVSGMGHLLGYARISTTDQQPHLQVDALERAGCYRVFTETASGARSDRPTLEQLLDQLRPSDALAV